MMTVARLLTATLGVGLAGLGVAWLVAPGLAAAQLGMTLQGGIGLSSQIGDGAGYFVTLGGCILIGLIRRDRVWFYPALSLLGVATLGRLSGWLFHGAALAVTMILFEVVLAALLLMLARRPAPRA